MTSTKDEAAVVQSEDATKTRSKGVKGHCKRFWWVYLLVLVVIIVIAVPVIILVAVPKIAQNKINEATLRVDGVVISQTKANSLNMAINSTILADSSVHATIAGFQGAMYLDDVNPPLAFAQLTFPEVVSSSQVTVNLSQTLNIADMAALSAFNTYFLQNEVAHIRIAGDTTVRVSGIARDYPVTFSKSVEMKGFNGFKGLNVTNPLVNSNKTNNFNGTANIPNPTIWTLEVGNVTFHNYFNGSEIGLNYINNMVLRPGTNSFFISADLNQGPILEALTKRPACETGKLSFQLSGKSVQNNGEEITYLSKALASSNQTVEVDVGSAVKKSLGLSLPCSG